MAAQAVFSGSFIDVTIFVEIAMTRVSNDMSPGKPAHLAEFSPGRMVQQDPFSFSVCFNTRGQPGNQYLINLQPVHIHYFE